MIILNFIARNWDKLLMVIVGAFALLIYILQERRKKIDAASLIVLQIDEFQKRLQEISSYIVEGQLNEGAFYESLPLMEENYWNKYKHYFVRDMDATSYASINQLYDYVSEIQEQQLLMKAMQKNSFMLTQAAISNIESQFIIWGLNYFFSEISPQNVDFKQFWTFYNQQNERLKYIINQRALTQYIPVQIRISLDNILKKCSMLEVTGRSGYQMLNNLSKKKS